MKRIGICLLAAWVILACASCGARVEVTGPENVPAPESAAASSQPAGDGLDLDDFTVVAFDKDGLGDHGCRYEMTGQEQSEFLALLQPQHWIEATELPEIGVSGLTVLDETGERSLVVGRYQEQALIPTGDKAYFAPLAVYEAARAFEKPFLQRKQEEKTQQASGASPEKEAEGAESRPEGSAPSSSPEQPPVPQAASFCMIETTGSDRPSFYPLSDSEQQTFRQLLRMEEWRDPAAAEMVHMSGLGSPCIIVGQKDGDATLYLSPGFTRRDGTSPGQFPPDLEVKNTLILIKYGEGQKYHAAYFAPVEVLAEAEAFRLRCRMLHEGIDRIDARWEELQP